MKTADIRNRFLAFMESKGHLIVPSASLVSDDPTVMFNIAGMVPMVPYLTGREPAPAPRVADVQKCIRTNDIEEVGKTPRHGTFFQMLGNWSFGDYFKKEAIEWAWEFLTGPVEEGNIGLDKNRMWATVYETDDEAEELWATHTDLPRDRVQRLGRADNYWNMGQAGPGGPDSEIFYDLGPEHGVDGGPITGDDRYVEIWNLVFMQDLLGQVRSKTDFDIVGELPHKNIDTGMGLERVAFITQGVQNMYEIDEVRPVLDRASELSGRAYGANHEDDVRMRVVADHVRSGLMLISDGVSPSNDGRGYILRRLLRRAIRNMRLLGVETATFPELFVASRDAMKASYPELESDWQRISRIAFSEEQTFLRTLAQGENILDAALETQRASGARMLSGDTAFVLHDTYGFPVDLTVEVAEEHGLTVNREAFDRLMAEQRSRAKADAKSKRSQMADLSVYRDLRALGETVFTGYTDLETETEVLGIIVNGHSVPRASAGETAEIITRETSLYAESGGQDADEGRIIGQGFDLDVQDVQRPVGGLVSHTVVVASGEVAVGDTARTVVDAVYRQGASQAHTATHLIHAALRDTLGPSAHQSGSYNRAGYMRLDYSWSQPLSGETKSEIEEIANDAIRSNYQVTTREMSLDEAKQLGAMALFGEKYGNRVRMVEIGGPWSRELCGGTHVGASSEVGIVNLVGDSSVGSTNRRVESLVGRNAFQEFAAERAIVRELSANLKTPKGQLTERIAELSTSLKAAEKRIAEYEAKALQERVPAIVEGASRAGKAVLASASLGTVHSVDDVRQVAMQVRQALGSDAAVATIAGVANDKPIIVVATNDAARSAGVKAGQLVRTAAGILGGGGGGKDDIAQGGGQDASKIDEALAAIARELA